METLERVRLYPLYERVWHWAQALSTVGLLLTGFEVHGTIALVGFATAVSVHEALGLFLLANAFLGLFYFVASGAIRQYVAAKGDLPKRLVAQALWYARGIFRGERHPVAKTAARRLNPLQRATYVLLLNVLLPWQIVTGLAMWGLSRWPAIEAATGGLAVLSPLHTAGSWLFLAFLVGHVYLTTTGGHRPLAAMKAMVTGFEDVPRPAVPEAEASR